MLDKLQKGYVGMLVLHLLPHEPLAHRRNKASLCLFYRYYFGRCSYELVQLVPLPYSRGRSTRYSDGFQSFLSPLPVIRMSMLTVSLLTHVVSGILCL